LGGGGGVFGGGFFGFDDQIEVWTRGSAPRPASQQLLTISRPPGRTGRPEQPQARQTPWSGPGNHIAWFQDHANNIARGRAGQRTVTGEASAPAGGQHGTRPRPGAQASHHVTGRRTRGPTSSDRALVPEMSAEAAAGCRVGHDPGLRHAASEGRPANRRGGDGRGRPGRRRTRRVPSPARADDLAGGAASRTR